VELPRRITDDVEGMTTMVHGGEDVAKTSTQLEAMMKVYDYRLH
jgi:hypothetical protein